MERYWIRQWVEVDKETWVAFERRNGFRNTMGEPDEPATSSFSGKFGEGTTRDPREGDHV